MQYREDFYNHYASTKTLLTKDASVRATHLTCRKPFLMYIIKKHFPSQLTAKIIDLGCGDGALLFFAKKMGYKHLVGYDVSDEQIDLSRSIGVCAYKNEATPALQALSNDSVDVLIAFDVVEHMTKTEVVEFSRGVHRVLKSGGKWIIHTLNAESPFFGRIRYGDFTHENGFTNASIRQLLTIVGFQTIDCYEDAPVVHGVKSTLRFLLWKIIRNIYRFCLAAETGEGNGIFSQNFLVVARKG